jgi:hypothetical protein
MAGRLLVLSLVIHLLLRPQLHSVLMILGIVLLRLDVVEALKLLHS